MSTFTLQIHPSIRKPDIPDKITLEVEEVTVIEAIIRALSAYSEMEELILEDQAIKPGLLVFADKTELTSMGLLENDITSDLHIRIVPILHGG